MLDSAGAADGRLVGRRVLVVEGSSATVVTGSNGTGFDHNNGAIPIINTVLHVVLGVTAFGMNGRDAVSAPCACRARSYRVALASSSR